MTTEPVADEPLPSRLQPLAARLGLTEGQLYTAVIGLVLATTMAVLGVPPTLREPAAAAPSAPQAAVPGESPPVVVPTPDPSATLVPPLPPLVTEPVPGDPPLAPGPAAGPSAAPTPGAGPQPSVVSLVARIASPGSPAAVAYLPDGSVVVGTNNTRQASRVLVLGRSGALVRSIAVTGQPQQRTAGLVAAAADRSGRAYLLDASTSRVLQLDARGRSLTTRATIPNVSPCLFAAGAPACEAGLQDRTGRVSAIAVDGRGAVYVADAGQAIIWRVLPGESVPQPWYSSPDLATGDAQAGLALDGKGRLLFTVGTSNDLANLGGGGLYRLEVNADGTAGTRTLVRAFTAEERPGALAVGASGTAYVVARGSGAIASVDPSGAEVGRLAPPGDGPVPLDTPAGLAVAPGRLLVANQGSRSTSWAVLAVQLDDEPVAAA